MLFFTKILILDICWGSKIFYQIFLDTGRCAVVWCEAAAAVNMPNISFLIPAVATGHWSPTGWPHYWHGHCQCWGLHFKMEPFTCVNNGNISCYTGAHWRVQLHITWSLLLPDTHITLGDTTVSGPPASWNLDFFTKITQNHLYTPGTI